MNDDLLEFMQLLEDVDKYEFEELRNNYLKAFASESNKIEGIDSYKADQKHWDALVWFVDLKKITPARLVKFVKWIEPESFLRTKPQDNVYIGGHKGLDPTKVLVELKKLLLKINTTKLSPAEAHIWYESIHPFIDGNGRSGRALWLWMRLQQLNGKIPRYGFLQSYYYEVFNWVRQGRFGGKNLVGSFWERAYYDEKK